MDTSPRILKMPKVLVQTGLSKSAVYRGIKEGKFPQPIRLGKRSVGWLEDEVLAWLQSRIEASRP